MSHEIYELSNGKQSMAYIGAKPWHGLGQALTAGASLETWALEAGLNWTIQESTVQFSRELNGEFDIAVDFPGQKVLYRSDNGQPLSVVSDRYQTVQPIEVLDFFREFVHAGDMEIETAGTLGNGTKIWALARVGADFDINGDNGINGRDTVQPYVLLATSCDKSMATTGQLTSVRVVCNNTLQMSLGAGKSSAIKVPHSRKFNAESVKVQMGLARESIQESANQFKEMHKITVSDETATKFFVELLKTPAEKKSGEVDLDTKRRALPKLWKSYKDAPGSENTVWGLVNAVTHSVDYNPHARTDSSRLNSAWFGQGANQKAEAVALATDTQFLDSIIEKTTAKTSNDQTVGRLADLVDF